MPGSMAFVTDSNRPQQLWQPPPTAHLTAFGAASEAPSLLVHPLGLEPLPQARSTTAWHSDLLNTLLAEWTDGNMTRLQQWFIVHATDEMQTTLNSLSTANTTKRALHSGLRSLLRGACVPPLIFFSTSPKNDTQLIEFLGFKQRPEEPSLVDILHDMMIIRESQKDVLDLCPRYFDEILQVL